MLLMMFAVLYSAILSIKQSLHTTTLLVVLVLLSSRPLMNKMNKTSTSLQ